jgi:hypothetical protein
MEQWPTPPRHLHRERHCASACRQSDQGVPILGSRSSSSPTWIPCNMVYHLASLAEEQIVMLMRVCE